MYVHMYILITSANILDAGGTFFILEQDEREWKHKHISL